MAEMRADSKVVKKAARSVDWTADLKVEKMAEKKVARSADC